MKEPLITDEAKDDLTEIWATIANAREERRANKFSRKILDACRIKAEFPESGRSREDLAHGLRIAVVRPYPVFYRHEGETILVLRVLHGRRDVEQIMVGF